MRISLWVQHLKQYERQPQSEEQRCNQHTHKALAPLELPQEFAGCAVAVFEVDRAHARRVAPCAGLGHGWMGRLGGWRIGRQVHIRADPFPPGCAYLLVNTLSEYLAATF